MPGVLKLTGADLARINAEGTVITSTNPNHTVKLSIVDDYGSLINPGWMPERTMETGVMLDALRAAQHAKSLYKLDDKSIVGQLDNSMITTVEELSNAVLNRSAVALDMPIPSPRNINGVDTPNREAEAVDSQELGSPGNLSSQGIVVDVMYPFSKNLKELAGDAISTVQTSRDLGSITRKDVNVISKIIVMPSWDNEFRARVNTQNYEEIVWSTSDFVLQSVSEQDAEKYQIIETFEDNLIYFYGRRPRVFGFRGQLLNSEEHQHKNNFIFEYANRLRGTKCVENKTRAYVIFEDNIVEGYILNVDVSTSSEETKACPFSFSMYVTSTTLISLSELQEAINLNANEVGLRNVIENYERANGVRSAIEKDPSIAKRF